MNKARLPSSEKAVRNRPLSTLKLQNHVQARAIRARSISLQPIIKISNRYSIVADDTKAREHFSIDPKNGSLYLMTDVDREVNDRYEAKVRVDRVKIGRGMSVMIYPVVGERLNGLAPNEARVVVRVKDVNDNAPRFKSKGRPILAAIPTTAHYGYEVVKVEVRLHACCVPLCVVPL